MRRLRQQRGRPGPRAGQAAGPAALGRFGAWLRATLLAESERWPLWLPVSLAGGIALYFGLPFEPAPWAGAAAATAALALLLFWRNRPVLFWAGAGLAAAAVGFAAAQLRTHAVDGPRLQASFGPARVAGQVLESEPTDRGHRVILGSVTVAGLAPSDTPQRVRLRLLPGHAPPAPGSWIEVKAVLNPLPAPTMPGGFDFQRHAFFQRLGAIGFALGPPVARPDGPRAASWRVGVESLRQDLDSRLRAGFAQMEGNVRPSIASALITGKRADIPTDVLDAMRDSGLAHLLAISGLHFAMVAGLIFLLVRAGLALVPPLALRMPIKKWAAVAAFLAASCYLLLSGATPPTQRAFLMLSMALLAILADRLEVSMRPVAWAAGVMLLAAPEMLIGASFQMSFAAVIGLVAAYEALRGRRGTGRPWVEGIAAVIARPALYAAGVGFTSIVAGLATAPFSLYHFNQLSSYGVLANLAAVPVTAFWVMPAGLAAIAAMPLGLEHLPLSAMGAGIDLIVAVARTTAGWPGAVWHVPRVPAAAFAAICLGGLWLALWRRRWRLLGLVAVGGGIACLLTAEPPHLLVAHDGRLIGARGPDGALWVSSLRSGRFVREAWERGTAATQIGAWPREGRTADGALSCDRLGCVYSLGARRVAIPADGRAFEDDCGAADVIVSRLRIPAALRDSPCGRIVIGPEDLRRGGAHALWLQPDGQVRIRTARAAQGERPWVLPPAPAGGAGRRGGALSSGAPDRSADPES